MKQAELDRIEELEGQLYMVKHNLHYALEALRIARKGMLQEPGWDSAKTLHRINLSIKYINQAQGHAPDSFENDYA